MQGVDKDLARDIECHTCGEDPSPITLLRAPRLENWSACVGRQGKGFVLVAQGNVYRHPDPAFTAGTHVTTSAVVWFDRHRRWIRTRNRLYVLGEPASGEGFDA